MGRRTLLLIAAMLIAALGTGLIWFYVDSAVKGGQEGFVAVQVYRSTEALTAGSSWAELEAKSQVELKPMNRDFVGDAITVATAQGLKDLVLLQKVPLNQALTLSMFGSPATAIAPQRRPDKLALEVSLSDPARVAGLLTRFSHVMIFLTSTEGTTRSTQVLLPDMVVLTVGGTTAGTTGSGVPGTVVTLEVDQQEAKKLIFAQSGGGTAANQLWFALRGDTVPTGYGSAITANNLLDGR